MTKIEAIALLTLLKQKTAEDEDSSMQAMTQAIEAGISALATELCRDMIGGGK